MLSAKDRQTKSFLFNFFIGPDNHHWSMCVIQYCEFPCLVLLQFRGTVNKVMSSWSVTPRASVLSASNWQLAVLESDKRKNIPLKCARCEGRWPSQGHLQMKQTHYRQSYLTLLWVYFVYSLTDMIQQCRWWGAVWSESRLFEPRREKTGFSHMRKQRRRSASR